MKQSLATNLKQLRKHNNLTQQQLAERLNIARQTVASYESGRTEPDIATLESIAKIFDISVDQLIGKTQQQSKQIGVYKSSFIVGAALNIVVFLRNVLCYVKNRFFWVQPGVVTDEIREALEKRMAVSEVIYFMDSYFAPLLAVVLLGLVFYVFYNRKKLKPYRLMVTLPLIVVSIVANVKLAFLLDPNRMYANYNDILLAGFFDNDKIIIVSISLAVAAAVYFYITDSIGKRANNDKDKQ